MKPKLKILLAFSTLMVFPCLLFAQELKLLIDSIAKYNGLSSQYISYPGIRSEQFDRVERFAGIATTRQLVQLTDTSNTTLKCAAFYALCGRDSVDIAALVKRHLYDTSLLSIQHGCIGSQQMTGDYFIENFYLNLFRRDSMYFLQNILALNVIDSILLYDPKIKLASKSSILRGLKAEPGNYGIVREIAENERLPVSVVTLAKYHKQQDKEIIAGYFSDNSNKDNLYYALWAVREFPDSSFYPRLLNVFKRKWAKPYDVPEIRLLYQALARYPNDTTIALFEKTVKDRRRYRSQALTAELLVAITKYPNERFERFKQDIHLDELHNIIFQNEIEAEE